MAVHNRLSEVVDLLIQIGANLDAKDVDGKTPLHLAFSDANITTPSFIWNTAGKAIAMHLIEAKADVNAKTKTGMTPLHMACRLPIAKVIQPLDALLAAGASLTASDATGCTPLHAAAAVWVESTSNVLQHLLGMEGVDKHAQDQAGKTLLQMAWENGSWGNVETLLNHHADPEFTFIGSAELPSVFKVVLHPRLLQYMVGKMPTLIYETTDRKSTPLHEAARVNPDSVKVLLDAGAPIEVSNNRGRQPLHLAFLYGHQETIRMLLERGADINAVDNKGIPAVVYAFRHPNHFGFCFEEDPDGCIKLFKDYGADFTLPSRHAMNVTMAVCENDARSLLGFNVDLAGLGPHGETLLHRACKETWSRNALRQVLQDRQVDLNTQNDDGETPLYVAVVKFVDEIETGLTGIPAVQTIYLMLQTPGLNIDMATNVGDTPLALLVRHLFRFNHNRCPSLQCFASDLIRRLINAGADFVWPKKPFPAEFHRFYNEMYLPRISKRATVVSHVAREHFSPHMAHVILDAVIPAITRPAQPANE